ncbi:hypothetical protein [Flavobacterium agrisoli]|uniref:Uncharacterized protein n=1 Tax=Flavobacterium agrisoli TaxID=2793066 RepID=A0A934PHY7_9FLAO|nr:hypothetical protein [Flavobacterium agrisoli]MBK0368441.1 hypothetical protein [Flavobacterium agrisoli]
MKQLLSLTFLFLTLQLTAQKGCDYSSNVTDSIGTYKSTRDYIISEKHFGGTASYVFFSLASTDGMPTLNLQLINKSKDFMTANCFDKNSRLILQLANGKIVTLYHMDQENCGTLIRDDKGFDNRVTVGIFMFIKGSIEELKKSPVSVMRIKYLTGSEDYVIRHELTSEMDGKKYEPDTYFMNNLKCVE